MAIIATAGHVDHGKSTLVRALTGRDPDRWKEEKARGLTIDLGFAWADLGTGEEAGFVDVPGHERFIKNMLAGVGAVDVALFVVAADEGWMPQSEEHMAILDLLGVRTGVVALTRIDLADPDLVELAHLEITERVAGTTLEGWPVVPVSPITGEGLDDLRTRLATALRAIGPAPDLGRPRLWVDRSFVVAGAGLVVTGTLVGGAVRRDEPLELLPEGRTVRIRGLQSHERVTEEVTPGHRAALNLSGVDRAQVPRGTLLARAGELVVTTGFAAVLTGVRTLPEPLTGRGAFHLHLGTATVPVRLRLLDPVPASGRAFALLRLRRPLPMAIGDRFVLRETGRRAVVAGGRVLDPVEASRLSRDGLTALADVLDAAPARRATVLVEVHGRLPEPVVAAATGGGRPAEGIVAAGEVISVDHAATLVAAMRRTVARFHEENPLRPGIPKAALASTHGLEVAQVDALLPGSDLVDEGATVRSTAFASRPSPEQEAAWEAARALLAAGLSVPRARSLGIDAELLHALVRSGALVRIAEDLVYLPDQIAEMERGLADIPPPFTVSRFREHFGLSRRHAVPLLEWFDARGITVREGDLRRLRRPIG